MESVAEKKEEKRTLIIFNGRGRVSSGIGSGEEGRKKTSGSVSDEAVMVSVSD